MSNLLNNDTPKKKLLNRGPKIVPDQEFKLEETSVPVEPPKKEQPATSTKKEAPAAATKKEPTAPKKVVKKLEGPQNTSVRVSKATRSKLNALIHLGKADNVDTIIDILLAEYIENNLVKDEKKTYNLILDIMQKRER